MLRAEVEERCPMGNLNLGWPATAIVLSAVALAACTTSPGPETRGGPPQRERPAKAGPPGVSGRWGDAAYHTPEDRARTEANARGQCKQPFVIGQGPNGGVMMYLADSNQLQELRLKGTPPARDYIGPAGETPRGPGREITSVS